MIWGGGGSVILNIIIGFGIIFIVKSTSEAKINKIFAFILSTITLIFLLIASFGLYIIIVMPIYLPRAFIGFNVLLAILSLYSITYYKKSLKIMSIILILIFAEYLISFANYYGQSLKAHNDYQNFRFNLLMNDLSKFLDNSDLNLDSKFNIIIKGYAGISPSIVYSKKYYPIIYRLIPIIQISNFGWDISTLEHYGISATNAKDYCGEPKNKQILLDSYYHTIQKYKFNNEVCYIISHKDITKHKEMYKSR